jgi:hypothetical protein
MQGLAVVSGRNSHLRSYALNSGDRLTQALIDPLQILHTFRYSRCVRELTVSGHADDPHPHPLAGSKICKTSSD